MKWLSVKERYYLNFNEVKSSSRQTVVIIMMPIFSPLSNKLIPSLHAA
jgi:hypothetical protein